MKNELQNIKSIFKNAFSEKIVPVITGPTASGKTDLICKLANEFPVEVISADSRQIYKYMDIGTAKPDKNILNKVPHHLISIIEPDKTYSSVDFSESADNLIKQIFDKQKLPVIIGGTGFYITTLFKGIFEAPEKNQQLRDKLEHKTNIELKNILKKIDPVSAEKIHINDKKRLIRAIEIFEITGKPLSELKKNTVPKTGFKPYYIITDRNRETLYNKINKRAELMIEKGWLNETQNILDKGYSENCPAFEGLGYRQIIDYFNKKISFDNMLEDIKKFTRRYAKRQVTWCRHQYKNEKNKIVIENF